MADYRPSGVRRNRLVAILLTLSVGAVALAAVAVAKLDLFADDAVEAPELPIAVSSRLLDFGAVPLNGAVIRHLVVRNDGSAPLHANLVLDGEKYSVTPSQLILHPGISSRIQIAVKADELGDLRDRLRIEVDEAERTTPLVISLRGEATAGDESGAAPAATAPPEARPQLRADAADVTTDGTADRAPTEQGTVTPTVVGVEGLVADASVGSTAGSTGAGRSGGAAPSTTPGTTARRRAASTNTSDDPRGNDSGADLGSRQVNGATVGPYVPGVSVPIRPVSEVPAPTERAITEYDRETARTLPERTTDGGELPDRLPEDEEIDDFDRDIFEDDDSVEPDPDPFTRPQLTISGVSTIQLMGSSASFYPQEIGLVGSDAGGPFGLTAELQMPMIYLAFGESMLFRQTGPVSGEWDPGSGQVNLQVPLEAVDTDGDAAPWQLTLTTGTVYARNPSGVVVSKTGTPRTPDSGILRLVAIFEIPVGFGNGAEKHLAVFEILGELSFGTDPRSGIDRRF